MIIRVPSRDTCTAENLHEGQRNGRVEIALCLSHLWSAPPLSHRLLAETGLLLGVLKGSAELTKRLRNGRSQVIVDYITWTLLIFGSDGIVGLLRKLQVKLGISKPRQTLAEATDTWYKQINKPSWVSAQG